MHYTFQLTRLKNRELKQRKRVFHYLGPLCIARLQSQLYIRAP